jgi:hypothetical protein
MNVRHALPQDTPVITALGGGQFATADFLSFPRTRLLVWERAGRIAAFAAVTWGRETDSPLVVNGIGPANHGQVVVSDLLALASAHGRPALTAQAPETDTVSRDLFTRFHCRTTLRRSGGTIDDIAYELPV